MQITAAHAALPPYREAVRELTSVLTNPEVARKIEEKLGAMGRIESIITVAPQTYRVWSGACSLDVNLIDESGYPPIEGAWQYRIEVGDLVCGQAAPSR